MSHKLSRLVISILVFVSVLGLSSQVSQGKTTTITFWSPWGGEYGELMKRIIKEYNDTHKIIQVKLVQTDTNDKLKVAIAAGSGPDVAITWGARNGYELDDWFVPLDAYISKNKNMDESKFFPSLLQWTSYGGKVYGFPFLAWAGGLMYNRTILKEIGLNPKGPETWNDLEMIMSKSFIPDPTNKRYMRIGGEPWYWPFDIFTWSSGGDLWDPKAQKSTGATDISINVLTWLDNLRRRYDSRMISGLHGADSSKPAFQRGVVTLSYEGIWIIAEIRKNNPKLDFGVCPIPRPQNGKKASSLGPPDCIWVPKGAKNPDEAFEFISWLVKDGIKIWTKQTGEVTCRYDTRPKPSEYIDPRIDSYYNIALLARALNNCPIRGKIYERIDYQRGRVYAGKKSPAQALADLDQDCDKELLRVVAEKKKSKK